MHQKRVQLKDEFQNSTFFSVFHKMAQLDSVTVLQKLLLAIGILIVIKQFAFFQSTFVAFCDLA